MSDDNKVTRRKFLVNGSVAAVGATAAAGFEQKVRESSAPSRFVSPDGSTIPF